MSPVSPVETMRLILNSIRNNSLTPEIIECFPNVKQVFLLCLVGSLVTLMSDNDDLSVIFLTDVIAEG